MPRTTAPPPPPESKLGRYLTIVVVVLACTNLATWFALRNERERSRAAADVEQAREAQLRRLSAERDELQTRLTLARRANAQEPGQDPGAAAGTSAGSGAVPIAEAGLGPGRRGPWNPPANLTRAQRKLMARQGRGELYRELGLSEQEIDGLLELDVEREDAIRSAFNQRDEPDEPVQPAELNAQLQAQTAKHERAVATLLGAEKSAALRKLEGTLPVRAEMRMVRDYLEGLGFPLDDGQRATLMQTMSAQLPGALTADPTTSPDEIRAQVLALQESRQERLRDAARGVLAPEQMAALSDYHELQRALQSSPGSTVGVLTTTRAVAP